MHAGVQYVKARLSPCILKPKLSLKSVSLMLLAPSNSFEERKFEGFMIHRREGGCGEVEEKRNIERKVI